MIGFIERLYIVSRAIRTHSLIIPLQFSPQTKKQRNKERNSVALSPQANYTYWATATCRRNLVPTFMDRGVSRGQRGGSPTVVNLSFLDGGHYFSFK
jgi:hypothetical protein